jgi:TetR/AcrR family acrAB operon transcriptional repressor
MERRVSKRAIEAERTRREILRVARKLFAEKGYAQTSITDIVEAADTYRSAVEWHFGGKEGLLVAVVEQSLEVDFQEEFEKAWAEYEKNIPGPWPEEAFKFYFLFMRNFLEKNVEIFIALFTLTFEQLHKNITVAEKIRGFFNNFTMILRDAIQMGQDQGIFRKELDPLWTAKTIIALSEGLFMQWYIDPENEDAEKIFTELTQTTYRILYPDDKDSTPAQEE